MRFSAGEDARVDCGVFTGGDAEAVTINWIDSSGKTIETNSSARSVERESDAFNRLPVNHVCQTYYGVNVWPFSRHGYPLQMLYVMLAAGNDDSTNYVPSLSTYGFLTIPQLCLGCF